MAGQSLLSLHPKGPRCPGSQVAELGHADNQLPYLSVPGRYKRKGSSCLGLNPKKQCISWEGTPREKKPAHKHSNERYFSRKNISLLSIDGVALSPPGEPPAPATFIPLTGLEEASPPVTSWLNPLGIYDQATTQWLQGQGPLAQDSQVPDTQSDPEGALLRAKVEDFNRRVRESPHDVQLWMDFVAFQVSAAALAMRRGPGLALSSMSLSGNHRPSGVGGDT